MDHTLALTRAIETAARGLASRPPEWGWAPGALSSLADLRDAALALARAAEAILERQAQKEARQ